MNTQFKGRFKYLILNPQQEIIQESKWNNNHVLDVGLNALNTLNPQREFNKLFIGTGNQEAQDSDTALQFISAEKYQRYEDISDEYSPNTAYQASASHYSASRIVAARFGKFKEGQNVAEVGLGYADSGSALMLTRALIKNHLGQPVTISVPKDHYFVLVYEFQQILKNSDTSASIEFHQDDGSKQTTTCTQRLFKAGHRDYSLYPLQSLRIHQVRIGTSALQPANEPYSNQTAVNYSVSQESAGAETELVLNLPANDNRIPESFNYLFLETSRGAYQFHFEPPLHKTLLQQMIFRFPIQSTREETV